MRCGQKILIVDGDAAMRATLREQLTRDAIFAVVEAADAREAEACLFAPIGPSEARFAAVIMDAMLPDGDGHDLCTRLRSGGLSMPVILMNGVNRTCTAEDTITLAKPFRLSELMAHLHARLGATRDADLVSPPDRFRIGAYDFHAAEKALHLDADPARRVRLTEKEVAILVFLHRMRTRAVPRDELLREVWGYNPAVTSHTLETHIYRLRRKIEAIPGKACFLVTEAGGYRLLST